MSKYQCHVRTRSSVSINFEFETYLRVYSSTCFIILLTVACYLSHYQSCFGVSWWNCQPIFHWHDSPGVILWLIDRFATKYQTEGTDGQISRQNLRPVLLFITFLGCQNRWDSWNMETNTWTVHYLTWTSQNEFEIQSTLLESFSFMKQILLFKSFPSCLTIWKNFAFEIHYLPNDDPLALT